MKYVDRKQRREVEGQERGGTFQLIKRRDRDTWKASNYLGLSVIFNHQT